MRDRARTVTHGNASAPNSAAVRRTAVSLLGALLGGLLAAVTLVVGQPAAQAADIGYRCQMAPKGAEGITSTTAVTLGLVLDVPDRATSGDQVSPSGALSISIEEPSRALRSLREATMDARGLSVGAQTDARESALAATWRGAMTDSSASRLALSGTMGLPSYTVPAKVDEVRFRLPDRNTVAATVGGGPVAFNLELNGTGAFGSQQTYLISCAAPSGDTTVARTAVVTPTPTTAPTPTAAPTATPGTGGNNGGSNGGNTGGSTTAPGGGSFPATSVPPELFPSVAPAGSDDSGEFGLDELGSLFATAVPEDGAEFPEAGLDTETGADEATGAPAPDATPTESGDDEDVVTLSDEDRAAGFDTDRLVQLGFAVAWAAVAWLAWSVWRRRRMAPTKEL